MPPERGAPGAPFEAPGEGTGARVSVVVLTHNRAAEVLRCLRHLQALPEQPPIIVVDNGSHDDTAQQVRQRFPAVTLVASQHNLGAAGRNLGVARVTTPYVAFCDDDTWWAPGALQRAVDALDAHPRLAAVGARVLVGPEQREDPTCACMARSPLPRGELPGPALIGFMAGAAVMRVAAFVEAGGYEPRLFIGGEERLLGLDLATRGWRMAYLKDVVTHHHPSPVRDAPQRRSLLARNDVWIACLRLSWPGVAARWRGALRDAPGLAAKLRLAGAILAGLPWVLSHRRPVSAAIEAQLAAVLAQGSPRQATEAPSAPQAAPPIRRL